jgi:hypothetical protein
MRLSPLSHESSGLSSPLAAAMRGFGHLVGSIIAAMVIMVATMAVLAGLYGVSSGESFPLGATTAMLFFPGYWAWRIFTKWFARQD